jgi:hypothetical protein
VAALLRTRVRYFSEGLALGTAAYVEEVFARNRERMGVKRERGAREARGAVGYQCANLDKRSQI